MTPREIRLALSAHRARMEQRRDGCLLLARYTALAVHDPARLPCLPHRTRDMTDEEMKQRLLAGAERIPHDA